MTGKTNSQITSNGGLILIDTAVASSAYSDTVGTIFNTYFTMPSSNYFLYVVAIENTSTAFNAAEYMIGGSLNGSMIWNVMRHDGTVVGSNYTVVIGADSTLKLYTVDYSNLI